MGFWNQSSGALLAGAMSVATLHALIPSHWLAFAVIGRSQRWESAQTLRVAALAGVGHVLFTTVLGIAVATAGKALWRVIPPQIEHLASAGVLIALGLYFLFTKPHHHSPEEAGEDSKAHSQGLHRKSERKIPNTIMGSLAMGMTLSPCLDLLSVYVAASTQSWVLILAVSLILCVTTLVVMLTLVWLTLRGLERLKLGWLEKYEGKLVGGVLIVLGLVLTVMK